MTVSDSIQIPEWAYAFGEPVAKGEIKSRPEDFVVDELLPFEPDGEGEHVFLQIRKRGENTEYVARKLARLAAVRQRDVGFAGLKDRHAVTTQWFSVWLPGKREPDWQALNSEEIELINQTRHAKKLRRGVIAANHFKIKLIDAEYDEQKLIERLEIIKESGFPNYFGPQRFGRDGQNVNQAMRMFKGARVKREQRGLYLSAARSYLFNLILSKRVELRSWDKVISGDVCQLNGNRSLFNVEMPDQSLHERVLDGDIHPAAILFGKQTSDCANHLEAETLMREILAPHQPLLEGLLQKEAKAEYRAMRAAPENLSWSCSEGAIALSFSLSSGSYATALLREIIG